MTRSAASIGLRLLRRLGHAQWLRYGVRDRVLRCAFPPDRVRDREYVVDFFGMRYRGNFANYIEWVVYFFGAYERHILALLADAARAVGPDAVCVDVGANVGQHTLFMSRIAGIVHAFEPYGPVRESMARKLSDNRIDNVVIHPVGLGERDEAPTYFAPTGQNTGTGGFVEGIEGVTREAIGALEVVNGDRYLARNGIERVDVIKVDAEGYDVFVLRGLADTIRRNRPVIVFECDHRCRALVNDAAGLRALAGEDHELFVVQSPRPRFGFFAERSDRYRLLPFRWNDPILAELAMVPRDKVAALRGQP